MRRDLPELFAVSEVAPLPASPRVVIRALEPLLTEERLARIDRVISGRTREVIPVLDGLIDPHNMSAVLRSADAFGVQEVHVVEGTEPFMASGRVTTGAERWLDLIRHRSAEACVDALHDRGYRVLVAGPEGDFSPDDLARASRVAVIFGNEHAGASARMKQLADGTYAVPMRGFVESLNVSVAAAITLQAATRGRAGDLSEEDRDRLRARFLMLSVREAELVVEEYRRRRGFPG